MKATVYKSTGSWYQVKTEYGQWLQARMKGVFKIDEDITSTNPIAVGDIVTVEAEDTAEKTVMITGIHDRRNYINRQSPRHKYQQHIVAANLDQSLLIATIKEPRTSTGFIDRFLVACEMYHVPAIIVFNKKDLYKQKELDKFEEYKSMYEAVGYKVLCISVNEQTGMEEIDALLTNKVSLVSGHSGVGKSSFVNSILPGKNIKTQDVSNWSGKGMHTTTFAEMYDLPNGGKLIDTPGMREFALLGVEKDELSHYFPEMRSRLQDCQFNNCQHINEPKCAIKKAVAAQEIHEDRYLSYLSIYESIGAANY